MSIEVGYNAIERVCNTNSDHSVEEMHFRCLDALSLASTAGLRTLHGDNIPTLGPTLTERVQPPSPQSEGEDLFHDCHEYDSEDSDDEEFYECKGIDASNEQNSSPSCFSVTSSSSSNASLPHSEEIASPSLSSSIPQIAPTPRQQLEERLCRAFAIQVTAPAGQRKMLGEVMMEKMLPENLLNVCTYDESSEAFTAQFSEGRTITAPLGKLMIAPEVRGAIQGNTLRFESGVSAKKGWLPSIAVQGISFTEDGRIGLQTSMVSDTMSVAAFASLLITV